MRPFWTHLGPESRMMRIPPATHGAHAHQVVGRKAHQRLPGQLGLTLELGLGQSAHGLDPAKGLFDALAHLQTGLVARVPLGAPIDGRVLLLGRHMGRDAQLAAALHEGLAVVVFVGAHGLLAAAAPLAPQHLERRLVLCRAIGMGDLDVHHQAVAVVHQDVAHVAQPRLVALGFLVQARIGIGAAGMGVVAALLAFEVDIGVAPSGRGWVVVVVAVAGLVAVFALEALVRCPSLDQGAVDAEMLVAGQ